MVWTDPTTRSTGDLITSTVWNGDVVDNLGYLHERVVTKLIPPSITSGNAVLVGDHSTARANGTYKVYFEFIIPTDFDALESLEVIFVPNSSGTVDIDLDSDYGNPAANEAAAAHSESLVGITQAVTAYQLYTVDISGVFSSMTAGDICGLRFHYGGAGPVMEVLGLRIIYTRT